MDAGTSVIKALVFDLKGEQLADASRAEHLHDRCGGAVEQDMARTWTDSVAVLAELTGKVADLKDRAAVLAITGQGDGTWLMDKDGEPAAPAWLWLDSRAAGIVHEMDAQGRLPRAHVSPHRLRPQRLQQQARSSPGCSAICPEVLARTTTGQSLQGLALFQADRRARHRRDRRQSSPSAISAPAQYVPEILEWMGIPEASSACCPRWSTARRTTHPLQAGGGQGDRIAGRPAGLARLASMSSAPRLGAGLYEPGTRRRLLPSSARPRMHMRLEPKAENVQLDTRAQRLHHGLSGAGCRLAACSPTWRRPSTSTGSSISPATPRKLGHEVGARMRSAGPGLDRVLDARPGVDALSTPISPRPASAGPFFNADARAQFIGLSQKTTLHRPGAHRVSTARPWPRAIAMSAIGGAPPRSGSPAVPRVPRR